jgi:hypothetical protein
MGGLYFSVNSIMSQVLLWGSLKLYIDKMEEGRIDEDLQRSSELTKETLYSIGKAINSVWLVSVIVFFLLCKKEHMRSFVGTANTKTYNKQCWDWQQMSQDPRVADEVIVRLFSKHHDGYKHFEDEVGAFVIANWEKWNHEKPKFFTNKFKKSIPSSVLSEEIREELMMGEHEMRSVASSLGR